MNDDQIILHADPVSQTLERVQLLFDVKKWDNALAELQKALSSYPDSEDLHYYASFCYYQMSNYDMAEKEAKETLRLYPDFPSAYWILASICLNKDSNRAGMKYIDQALEYNPEEPLYLATKAAILLNQNKSQKALEFAEKALNIEPEHEYANQILILALTHLGRHDEAAVRTENALSQNPDSSISWYQQGLHLLTQGRIEESKKAFLESLRLDPENENAQEGLLKAVATNHPFFALFWRWTLFLYRFTPGTRYLIIFGIWIGVRILRYTARSYPAYEPLFTVVALIYIAFVLYTWTAKPLFNLAIRKGWIK